MTLPNFGIPDPDTAVQQLASSAENMQQMMRELSIPLANYVANALNVVSAPIDYATEFANRRVGQRAGIIGKLVRRASEVLTPSELLSVTPQGFPEEHMPPAAFSPSPQQLAQFHGQEFVPLKPAAPPSTIAANTCAQTAGAALEAAFKAAFPDGKFVAGPAYFCWNNSVTPCQFQWMPYSDTASCPPGFGGLFLGGMSCAAADKFSASLVASGWVGGPPQFSPCAATHPPQPPQPECGSEGQPPCPTPPLPTTPPTTSPPPGSSCDTPIYMQFCTPKKPPPGTCTTDEQGKVTCTPQPPQPGPVTPPQPIDQGTLACALMPDGSLPPVGSEQWCGCIDAIVQYFSAIGSASLGLVGISDPTGQTQQTQTIVAQMLNPLGAVPLIGDAINGIGSLLGSVLSQLGQNVISIVGSQVVGSSSVMIGLSVCRTVLNLLKRLRVGTDALLWATVDIEVVANPLERIIDYAIDYVLPTEIPSIGECIECALLNTASPEQVRCWLLLRGANADVWLPVLYARREKLSTVELIELMRRDGFDDTSIARSLRNYGWIDEGEASSRVKLYNRLPERADFLHYLQRNVYDDDYVNRYELLDGFQERYLANFGDQLHSLGITEDQSRLDYAAHWINASPGELRELLYRLRPDDPETQNPFTIEDYERLLAEQDIAPWIRKRMAETAYRVPALGYLRDMYRNYVIDDEEMKGFHQDLGYTEKDSERFVEIDRIIRARIRASEGHGYTPSALAAAYSVGNIDADGVRSYMREQGFTDDESGRLMARAQSDLQRTVIVRARSRVMFAVLTQVKSQLDAGVASQAAASDAIVQLGWPRQFADGWVSLQAQGSRVKLINEVKKRIRSEFLSGTIDITGATNALQSLGIVPESLQMTIAAWTAEFTPKRKQRTAAQIANDLSLGEITTADAISRLQNLGYNDADKRLFLADAQRKLLDREARAASAMQRQERTQANELARLQREAQGQHDRLLQMLRRISSPSKLQKWAKLGLVGRDLFYDRLRTLGTPDHDIQRYWDEVCNDPKSQCVETTPTLEAPPDDLSGSGFPPDEPS
jgi:hypothetical protein